MIAAPAAPKAAVKANIANLADLIADTQQWWAAHLIDILIAAAIAAGFYFGLRVVRRRIRQLAARRQPDDVFAIALSVLARTKKWFLAFAAARIAVPIASTPPRVADVVELLFFVVAAFQVAIWVRELILTVIRRRARSGSSETLSNALTLINVLVTVALFTIAGIAVLGSFGVNVSALIAGLGIGGIAIGLAAKGVFEDLFSALAIIFDRPFHVGDTIGYGQTTGTVERIGLKTTRLRALTGERIIISNQKLLDQEVRNLSDLSRRRFSVPFGVHNDTSARQLARVPDVVRAATESVGAELVRCSFTGFGASSLDHEWLFDVPDLDMTKATAVRHRAAVALVEAFEREAIIFSLPMQVSLGPDPAPHPPNEQETAS